MVTLYDVLKDENSLDSFMIHLAKSYSMEILLSLIEFVQYQQWLKETLYLNETNDTNTATAIHANEMLIEFPSDIPVSEIIEIEEIVLMQPGKSAGTKEIQTAKI